MSNRQKKEYIFTFIAEILALFTSIALSMLLFGVLMDRIIFNRYSVQDYTLFLFILLVSLFAVFVNFEQISGIMERTLNQQIKHSLKHNIALAGCTTLLMFITKAALLDSRYLLIGILLWNMLISVLYNRILQKLLHNFSDSSNFVSLVGIITVSERVENIIDNISKDWSKNICGIAIMDAEEQDIGKSVKGISIKADYNSFISWIRQEALDEVYIDIPYNSGDSLTSVIYELSSMGVDIHINIPFLDSLYNNKLMPHLNTDIESVGSTNMLTMKVVEHSTRGILLKRLMDIAGSIVGLIISIPIIAITAIPLKLESPGPLFFKQKRVGLNGRFFYIYKLRSMYIDAEERKKELMAKNEMKGLMFKMTDDPRITKVGKFIRKTSIDELPQFLNVLKGDMSLVGTRPPTVDEYKQYESHHKRRLSMKPGITGLWQVSGRSSIEDFEDVIKLDVKYIDNWTIWQDFKILLKTVKVVFVGRGAK